MEIIFENLNGEKWLHDKDSDRFIIKRNSGVDEILNLDAGYSLIYLGLIKMNGAAND